MKKFDDDSMHSTLPARTSCITLITSWDSPRWDIYRGACDQTPWGGSGRLQPDWQQYISRHGMHLKPHCKKMLFVYLLMQGLRRFEITLLSPSPATVVRHPVYEHTQRMPQAACELMTGVATEPYTLWYKTFADTVRAAPPPLKWSQTSFKGTKKLVYLWL